MERCGLAQSKKIERHRKDDHYMRFRDQMKVATDGKSGFD
jgi:hypothetical protein